MRCSICVLAAASQRDSRSIVAGSFSAPSPRSRTACITASMVTWGVGRSACVGFLSRDLRLSASRQAAQNGRFMQGEAPQVGQQFMTAAMMRKTLEARLKFQGVG
jgi:hypothetical protein